MSSSLQNSFSEFCNNNKFEINKKQTEILTSLEKFIFPRNKLLNFFSKKEVFTCFYLYNFHNFRHQKKNDNTISEFVKNLKNKYDFIYLDEFQVTNIVDAMILGKLFENIFLNNIKILITTNTRLTDLYKDGLQREQFIPFISLIEKKSVQKELILEDDYRTQNQDNNQRIFYPLNEKTLFKINQKFRIFTKNLKKEEKSIFTKGRVFKINNYYGGLARFDFKELCDQNLGAEDYLNISKICNHIFIEEVPVFNEYNSNQQLRFITLIDILYEKKINLTLTMETDLDNIGTSKKHSEAFKRTTSRLHEMTASKLS